MATTKFASVGFGNSAPVSGAEKVYSDDETIALRVGGKRFETTVGTLRKYSESKLAAMFPEDAATKVPDSNEFAFERYASLCGKIQNRASVHACAPCNGPSDDGAYTILSMRLMF